MHYHALPCITMRYHASPGFTMIDSPGTKPCESGGCFFYPCGCGTLSFPFLNSYAYPNYRQQTSALAAPNCLTSHKTIKTIQNILHNLHHSSQSQLQIGSVIFLEISTEHWKWLQIGFEIFLEISTYHKWKHKVTTNWFFSFLRNQHRTIDKVYSLVYNFLAKTEWALFKNQVTTDWFCNFLGNEHWAMKMTTDWFCNFLGNQHLALWEHKVTTDWFFLIFLEHSLNWPIMSTVWFIIFLAKIEWAL